jgi:hypothetical protein
LLSVDVNEGSLLKSWLLLSSNCSLHDSPSLFFQVSDLG